MVKFKKLNKDQVYLLKLFLISLFSIVGVFAGLMVMFYFISKKDDLSQATRFNITAADDDT